MSDLKPGELFREEFRLNAYYGGELSLVVPEELVYEHPFLEWEAYRGGAVKLELDWDELKRLTEAIERAMEHKPDWS